MLRCSIVESRVPEDIKASRLEWRLDQYDLVLLYM